jgi:hypothetical protein
MSYSLFRGYFVGGFILFVRLALTCIFLTLAPFKLPRYIVVMSENRVDRLMKKRDEIARKINEKVSSNVSEYQEKIDRSLRENREALKKYYIDRMEEEINGAENAMNSGNIASAMTHKMQADMYSYMLRSI